jgi:RNA polymerase sigma factor (sigma-70 family)
MQMDPAFDVRKQNAPTPASGSFSDEALWSSFKTGNELALSILYKKYVQRLYDYGMHSFRIHDMVVDCLQELFLKLWNRRDTLATVHAVKPYLFKSFRRLLIHEAAEQRKKSLASVPSQAFEFLPSIESTLIEDELKAEQIKRLRQCVQSLTKGQREVIYLKFFSDLTYPEISEITEMQVDSVYNLVSKTIELLRKKLQITKPLVPLP